MTRFLHIGFEHRVKTDRIIGVVSMLRKSRPLDEWVAEIRSDVSVGVNCTAGRKPLSVVLTDDGRAWLSAKTAETLAGRMGDRK